MTLPQPPVLSDLTKAVLEKAASARNGDAQQAWEHSAEQVTGVRNLRDQQEQDAAGPQEPPQDNEKPPSKSASTVLVEIAVELYEFGVSDVGETYGVPRTGKKVVRLLRGGKASLRGQLAREYFRRHRRAASQQALADALLVVEGIAQDSDEARLSLRVAKHEDALWLDLGDLSGRAVRVTADGWTVEDRAPVLFKRTALNSPLPVPVSGGDINELWSWLNVCADDRPLVLAWLVSVLFCDIPHPVLSLAGEQGTGKTTAEKVLVSILDPSPVPTRKPPRDADSWVTAASGSWVVGLDNLSDIPLWLSDSICRAVTGDGDVRRKLYTDGDMAVFAFRRCIVLNGIDLGAIQGDLADRLLPINLELIPESHRREEDEFWPLWPEVHPRLLGAVLTLVAGIAGVAPSVHIERRPRMADFARVLGAVDQLLGTDGLSRYMSKQSSLAQDSLTGDEFVTAIQDRVIDTFKGTAAALLARVKPDDEWWRPPKGWPSSARAVTQRLNRQAPVMRKAGWVVANDGGANHGKVLRWTITPPKKDRDEPPQSPQSPHSAGNAGVAGHGYGPSQDDLPLWQEAPA